MPAADLVANDRPSRFSEDEREKCLTVLAWNNGKTRQAAEQLKAAGINVAHSTLHTWMKDTYAERFARIEQEILPQIQAGVTRDAEAIVRHGFSLQEKLLTQIDEDVENHRLEPKDKPGALQKVGITTGVAFDKAQLGRGLPTSRVATADPLQIVAQINRQFPGLLNMAIESPTVEAEVVEEDQPAREDMRNE